MKTRLGYKVVVKLNDLCFEAWDGMLHKMLKL